MKFRKLLNIKSVTTVKNYVDFFEEAYLLFSLYKFDYSVKKQIINDRKIYAIDTGILNAVSFRVSRNSGRLLENAIFIELKRRGEDVYYYRGKKECDFVLRSGTKITTAIQVTQSMEDLNTKEREIAGLIEALRTFSLHSGLIITENQEDEIKVDGKVINIIPAWKWILNR